MKQTRKQRKRFVQSMGKVNNPSVPAQDLDWCLLIAREVEGCLNDVQVEMASSREQAMVRHDELVKQDGVCAVVAYGPGTPKSALASSCRWLRCLGFEPKRSPETGRDPTDPLH